MTETIPHRGPCHPARPAGEPDKAGGGSAPDKRRVALTGGRYAWDGAWGTSQAADYFRRRDYILLGSGGSPGQ